MHQLDLWEEKFIAHYSGNVFKDKSHDLFHFKRVWNICKRLNVDEKANSLVLLASSYFHDLVNYPKDSSQRSLSSKHSAIEAEKILSSMGFPEELLANTMHCIEAHSHSASIETETLEAMIVQDADRMESLGAIGIARTFYVSGIMGSSLFDSSDPSAKNRDLDDKRYALDHFWVKLFKIPETMKTEEGKLEASKRVDVLKDFVSQLEEELRI
ncbi:HD domain-containing protein [Halobacteriovorax sp.]|uniref:HD domain-containing protein n=1 Tax=Halobacteriovorax sp. TaxID=2020862 RepID=UPI003564348E